MFKRAERKKARLRLALCAPSGAGKTYSALLIAQGLGGRIAMIDTERGSGELYSHLCEYDVCQLEPPYTPRKYVEAIHEAERAGYSTIIIDSLSHAWAGQGGLLEEVDKRKGRGNDFTAWRDITPMHNALVDAMLQSSCHIIATMRTKTAYEIVKDERTGKTKPVKVGLAPVQRDGLEYEFTVVLDIDIDKHVASASKDRTSLFDGERFVPSEETGRALLEWLESGAEPSIRPAPPQPRPERVDLAALAADLSEVRDSAGYVACWNRHRILEGHPDYEAVKNMFGRKRKEIEARAEAAPPGFVPLDEVTAAFEAAETVTTLQETAKRLNIPENPPDGEAIHAAYRERQRRLEERNAEHAA
ncbi:ATP-binding protein [uncultured Bilophila sp.]|uniref:ATP-binding protein n=1 Tax=uncultured Bilophila sp. TaxID=529385 RepID=UPI0026358E4F|nr:ATP-binding protein [uncultured Bilophila sp.]